MVERSLRYRVNVSTSVRGVKTWDCTVELEGPPGIQDIPVTSYSTVVPPPSLEAIVLSLSDQLVKKLEDRYPIQITQ